MNLLIVDDQKHIRDGLQAMVSQFPQQPDSIYSAANGIEALQLLRQYSIQLVITDIRMPDMDGLELMARTREEQLTVDYLIISGYGDFAYAQKAIGLGAKGYLLKPVNREDLQASVEHVWQEIMTRQALSRDMEQLSRMARETDRKELSLYMQGSAYDEAWTFRTEQQHPELWASYRLCLLSEERRINQPGASSAHSMESLAYSVYGSGGCICLQRRPHLILAVDAAADTGKLPEALKAAQIAATAAITGPQQGLKALPAAYTEVQELYRHSYLFPELRCILPEKTAGLVQQWQLPMRSCTPCSGSSERIAAAGSPKASLCFFIKMYCSAITSAIQNGYAGRWCRCWRSTNG